jgi:sterol desaturase/sphingolipid hydroxylase (fatty acid hydroxylase superfamily)
LFFSLALNYEWVHFLIHTAYVPRTRFYRRLWRNHRLHHYKNEHYWYGVTMLSGDRLLQTLPIADVPRSETCRMLARSPSEAPAVLAGGIR